MPLMHATTDFKIRSRTLSGQVAHCGQCSAKHRAKSLMYSRCTQAFKRLSFGSAETCPQKAIQNAHSVKRCASIASASLSTLNRPSCPSPRSRVSRSSMRLRMSRRAARMMACFESK